MVVICKEEEKEEKGLVAAGGRGGSGSGRKRGVRGVSRGREKRKQRTRIRSGIFVAGRGGQ